MATLDEIAQALVVAEQQGDAEAVTALAQAYQEQKAAQTPVLQDTGQGRFTSALSNVARGVTSIGPNVVGGLGYLTGSETLQEAGESMEQGLQRAFPVNPLYENEFSQKAANVIGQAGGTLATGGVGGSIGKALGGASAIGKGAQAGALIPAFLAGTRGGGQEAERYGMTGGTAYARALLGGGIELASEKFLFGLGTETAAARRLLGESLDFGKGALLKAAGTEAGEEAAAQIGGNVATMALAPEGVETPGAFEGTLESAALGAVGGGFLGSVNALTGQPRKPVLDAEGNQVTVEGQPVFEDDLTPPEEPPESVAPLTVADVEGDPVLEPVIEAASETVVENADVLPITNQVLQEINAPTETETLPGEPVPEVEAEAPAQEAPVIEHTNETAQVEVQETGGPVAVEQLASEAIPEDQAQEGVEVGESEGAEVVAETPVAETPVAETPTPAPPRTPSRAATPIPQAGQQVQFRREGKPMTGTYRGRDRLGRHIVESEGREEFVASTPAVIENTPIQGVTTPETFQDKGVELSAASMRSRGRRGLTVQETEAIAQNFSKALRKGPPVRVVTAAQIANDAEFSEVRDAVGKVGGKVNQVEGWFDRRTNTVFLVADQVANARRARQVLIHEVIGHGGVMSVATPAEMRRIADIIRRVAPRIVSNVETYYKNASEAEKVREILARFSEDYTSADPANLPQGWKRAWEEIKQIVRAIIKKMGGDPNAFDDLDLHRFYTNAVRAVYEEGLPPLRGTGATLEGPELFSFRAYHGTPHAVERFSTSSIGTGEGTQAFGWGLYFAENKGIAEYYRKALSSGDLYFRGQPLVVDGEIVGTLGDPELDDWFYHGSETYDPEEAAQAAEEEGMTDIASRIRGIAPEIVKVHPGNLYTVSILPDQEAFLDWDKPMSEQSDTIKETLAGQFEDSDTLEDFYTKLSRSLGTPQKASEYLASIGIPGIRYLDANSRQAGVGTYNFVLFDESLVRVLEENGVPRESDTMMSLNYPGTEEAKEEIRRQEEAGVTNARETRARFAPADKENLRYIPTTQADFIKAAEEFMDSLPLAEAAQRVLDGQVPENMRPGEDGRQHVLVAEAIRRLSVAAESTTDPYEQAEYLALANQMALKFAREGTADGRALNSRATANTLLAPIAPVLAAQRIMRERITKTLDARFDGGTEAVTQRVRKVSEDAAAQASEDVAAELVDEAEVESEANDLRQRAEVEAERIISSLVRPKEYEKAEVHPVRAVYNEHMEKPMERAAFEARVVSLGVDPQTAANLYSIAEQELRGRQMSEQLKQRKKTEAILAKDSPKLVELLNKLRKKMFPGTNWRTIFEDLPDQQLARQKAIYERLRKDERLRNLTTEEGVALTNELDKAWQRQRRKVFLEDLKRQGVLGEKDAADRQKVAKAYPKIIRALNLGTFNSELMREAMASEYGIRTITAQEASELRKLAQEAYKQPEGILRDKKVAKVIHKLQNATGSSISELVNNYWVASVLSGTATMFDTYMSAFNGLGNNLLQAGALFARGQRGDALATVRQWFEGLQQGARESMLILAKGDYSVLKRFGTDLNKALEGDSNFRPIPLGESLWRNGNTFQKYGMAPVMMWTGRLMSAADHINNTATSYGAMAVARALHPEIYEGKGAFTKAEKDAAQEQALREVTGGAPLQTLEEKATVSKRTREILAGLLTTEQQEEANFIGDQAAYQNDPLGLFGSIYQGISAGIGTIERKAEALSTDPAVQSQFMRAILGGLAGGLRGLTGTKFMRFGFNFGNDITQYIPGTYLLQKLAPVYGTKMSRSQQDLLLGKNIFGLMAAVGVAAMFLDKDDDEDGWHIEGNWSGLNNDFKNQLRSQGKEPNTFWRRRPDGSIQRISYRSWPTSGIMVAVGSMNDQKRYQPAKWKETGLAAHLLRAVGNGALQVKDTTALSGLSELLGVSSYSTDPEKSAVERLAKTAFKFEGGFFPTLLKDIDSWEDPNNYRPETLLGEMVRHVPLARRSASDGRPMLNLLGEPVELSRVPWRRVYTESKEGPEYTVLGQLLSRGLSLPEPSSKRTVKVDGQTTTIEQMGPRAEWEFARILGEKYRDFLLREGPTLERLDNDRAEKRIRKRAQDLGDQAENEMVRLLKANP